MESKEDISSSLKTEMIRLREGLDNVKRLMYEHDELQGRQAWLLFEEWKETDPKKRFILGHFALSWLPNPIMAKYLDAASIFQEGIERGERCEKILEKIP